MKRIVLFAFLFELILFLNSSGQIPGLSITGNPESANGAGWTYYYIDNEVTYDLQGILFKPIGSGKFPSVIINHGTGGNAYSYSKNIAKKMVEWGYVCIATNYTHSGGVPCGSPGICELTNYGSSNSNVLRGMKCWDILASLTYTDTNRIATFGHSRGAFLTTSLVANNPGKFKAASHTAGGIIPGQSLIVPTISVAEKIKIPYLFHHGDADNTVPLLYDQRLDSVLSANHVIHQLYIYPGYSHADISLDALMFDRTKKFFDQYVVNPITNIDAEQNAKQGQGIHFIGQSGVYYLGSADVPISSTKYEKANISGVVCRFKWASVEPSPGVFNWAFVDAEIQKARNSRKKISLQPLGIPLWMKDLSGVEMYNYIDKNQYHDTYGDVLNDVIPWGDVYLSRLKIFIQNLAAKYANDTTVTYINAIGGHISRGLPDSVVVDVTKKTKTAFWKVYPYSAEMLSSKMTPIIDFYMIQFPKTPLWCSVDYVSFETKASGKAANYLASLYTNYGISNYPDRFGLFREDIAGCTNFPPNTGSQWHIMKNNQGRTGAQMLWSVQDGPERMNKCGISPNTKAAVLDSAVNKGLAFGMRYIEIYGADIDDLSLAATIEKANRKLIEKGKEFAPTVSGPIEIPNVSIYPNPAKDQIAIEFPGKSYDISIFDLTGSKVFQEDNLYEKIVLQCQNFCSGIYLIKFSAKDKTWFTKKITILN